MQDFFCDGDSADASILTPSLQDDESMPPISDEIKTFIVKALATFDTPSEVAAAVKTNFGVELSRQHVYGYDPKCSKPPAPRWCALHAATRAAFLSELAEIGIAHKAFRLRALDRMVHHAMKHRFSGRAQSLLEQAAKECGGVFEHGYQGRDAEGETAECHAKPARRGRRKIYGMAQLPESR